MDKPRSNSIPMHDNTTPKRYANSPAPVAREDELRKLATDIVRYCPSLTHFLLAMGSKKSDPKDNPLHGLN